MKATGIKDFVFLHVSFCKYCILCNNKSPRGKTEMNYWHEKLFLPVGKNLHHNQECYLFFALIQKNAFTFSSSCIHFNNTHAKDSEIQL